MLEIYQSSVYHRRCVVWFAESTTAAIQRLLISELGSVVRVGISDVFDIDDSNCGHYAIVQNKRRFHRKNSHKHFTKGRTRADPPRKTRKPIQSEALAVRVSVRLRISSTPTLIKI